MEEIIKAAWFQILSFTFGAAGILLSIIFYRNSKKEKRPCCINRSNNLIYKHFRELEDLQITANYKGVKVETLSYTKVAFWNIGKETIKKDDLSNEDPLRIIVKDEKVYDVEIIYTSKKANNFIIDNSITKNEIYLTFDYIDYNQGVIIKIIHSGNTNSFKSKLITCEGSIRGATKIEQPDPTFGATKFLSDSKLFYEDSILI
jgi:hypothetical protein